MLYQTSNPHGGDIYGEEILLDFSANTNPFGTPQRVLDAVRDALEEIHRYPDPYCRKLIRAIADFEEIPQTYILCGNGAAELIYSYCEAVRPKTAVELAPTFSEYSLALQRTGCNVNRYFLSGENQFEVTGDFLSFLGKTNPDAIFLCNPNNPTGRTIDPEILVRILEHCRKSSARLFLDECFLDLSDREETMKGYLENNPNLFLLKAFTKSYGMAGIRLGYGLTFDAELLTKMAQTVQPWNVSGFAQVAGVAALRETEFLKKTRALIQTERRWLKAQLESLGYAVCPSEANYLLFKAPADLYTKLRKRKIAIRNCDNYPGLGPGWYRIAVRLPEENQWLIQNMKEV